MDGCLRGPVLIIALGELGFEEGDFFFKIFEQTTIALLMVDIDHV